ACGQFRLGTGFACAGRGAGRVATGDGRRGLSELPRRKLIVLKLLFIASLVICVPLVSLAQTVRKVFPYEYTIDDLPNGLRLITVPTDYPNLVAQQIVVQTGSRNEPEKGKSGYAHLFEHLMFRGSEHYPPQARDTVLKKAGADSNAYTTDDRTV